ncbi:MULTISPECIES: nucleotidyltransferase family protein [Roseateles]|uniref:Nucleotidyltransferase family protein n=1 Tax=Roseateles albus TaxID=2987525 RepID=A0ABT5KF08_9BURK|nr:MULTISPECIES: nucleotidyltransferase family protein [Roseateles]MCV2358721.1 nucleotidyltransferase family protein [Paucibacter sp. TC2R-5]MDC8771406.1 nucleotidyltransferase family protein [Roseateles albus]
MAKRRPAVIVLAAGRGMRFLGQGHKLEQHLGGALDPAIDAAADTVLAQTLAHVIATGMRLVVVTTQKLTPLIQPLIAARDVVAIPEFDGHGRPTPIGMGYSIAAGVEATGDADGWLIVPADMPLLRPATMLAVAAALEHYPVAYAQHHGRQGHPVGFSAELYSELIDLQGDEGARRIVARYPSQAVEVDDPGVLIDVDTVEDLARLKAQYGLTGLAEPIGRQGLANEGLAKTVQGG